MLTKVMMPGTLWEILFSLGQMPELSNANYALAVICCHETISIKLNKPIFECSLTRVEDNNPLVGGVYYCQLSFTAKKGGTFFTPTEIKYCCMHHHRYSSCNERCYPSQCKFQIKFFILLFSINFGSILWLSVAAYHFRRVTLYCNDESSNAFDD